MRVTAHTCACSHPGRASALPPSCCCSSQVPTQAPTNSLATRMGHSENHRTKNHRVTELGDSVRRRPLALTSPKGQQPQYPSLTHCPQGSPEPSRALEV